MVDSVDAKTYLIKKNDNLTKIAKTNKTTVKALLKLNPQLVNPDLIIPGDKLVISSAKPFIQREDYDPKKLNVGEITVNGQKVEGEFKSNFFANQRLDKLGNPGDKVVITLQGGKEANKDDLSAYSILNKVVANHLDNKSQIIDTDGRKRVQTQQESVESTDLYKAMISDKVNANNFDENGNLIVDSYSGNEIEIPTVGKDANGNTYFVLHSGNEKLYFDSTGKKAEFINGTIISDASEENNTQPDIDKAGAEVQSAPDNNCEFAIPERYDEKQLNLGTVFVNGKPVKAKLNSNFYRTEVDSYANETLNDGVPSRLDVQLKAGNMMNPKYNDDAADSILKKILGNNCDKVGIYQNKSNDEALALLRETDLYKAFVSDEVNGGNFVNGKLQTGENGFSTIQLPSLEVDKNGTRYYVLHSKNGILYFNDKGERI